VNPSADSPPKIGHDFSKTNKEVQKWKFSKSSFIEKCALKLFFFIAKKFERFE
jgi:hypothetical protein